MDILSDVNVIGNILTSGKICGRYLSVLDGVYVSDVSGQSQLNNIVGCSLTIRQGGSISSGSILVGCLSVVGNMSVGDKISISVCGDNEGVVINSKFASIDNEDYVYFLKRRNVFMNIPKDCTKFEILKDVKVSTHTTSYNNFNTVAFPVVQAYDIICCKTVLMDYYFCFNNSLVSIFGEKSANTTTSEFSFGVLLEQS